MPMCLRGKLDETVITAVDTKAAMNDDERELAEHGLKCIRRGTQQVAITQHELGTIVLEATDKENREKYGLRIVERLALVWGVSDKTLWQYSAFARAWTADQLKQAIATHSDSITGQSLSASHLDLVKTMPYAKRLPYLEQARSEGLTVHALRDVLRKAGHILEEPQHDTAKLLETPRGSASQPRVRAPSRAGTPAAGLRQLVQVVKRVNDHEDIWEQDIFVPLSRVSKPEECSETAIAELQEAAHELGVLVLFATDEQKKIESIIQRMSDLMLNNEEAEEEEEHPDQKTKELDLKKSQAKKQPPKKAHPKKAAAKKAAPKKAPPKKGKK